MKQFITLFSFFSLFVLTIDAHDKPITVVSQIVQTDEGRPYLEVEGKPFLYNSVQAWNSPVKEYLMDSYADNLNKAKEVGYRTFTFWLYWRDLEPEIGVYDWSSLNAMIDRANELDMRLEIVWGGTSFCGHIDPRFSPDWLLDWDEVHIKDENGEFALCRSGDFGYCRGADFSSEALFKKEEAMLIKLKNHLEHYDTNHRVIFFQVQNEPNLPRDRKNKQIFNYSFNDKDVVLDYCNRLGKIFKTGSYRIATRMNLAGKSHEPKIETLQYIDCHGVNPYTDDIDTIRKILSVPTKMPHLSENAAYKNTSSLMITAFANAAGYNIYKLGPCLVWENPGVFDINWEPWEVTFAVYNLNNAINKASHLLATASKSDMIDFNTETNYPDPDYMAWKELAGNEIGFKTWGYKQRNGSVGLALYHEGYYYLFGDRITWFLTKTQPTEISSGSFGECGQWIESTRKYTIPEEDYYKIPTHAGECLRIKL